MSIKWGQLYSNPNVVIARSDVHGYGVFARKDLQEGDLIAQSPYFTLDEEDVDLDDDGNGSVSLGRYVHPIDEIEEVEGDWLDRSGYGKPLQSLARRQYSVGSRSLQRSDGALCHLRY